MNKGPNEVPFSDLCSAIVEHMYHHVQQTNEGWEAKFFVMPSVLTSSGKLEVTLLRRLPSVKFQQKDEKRHVILLSPDDYITWKSNYSPDIYATKLGTKADPVVLKQGQLFCYLVSSSSFNEIEVKIIQAE